jgi:hypothetical protein
MPLNFYELYNLLNENIEENFEKWLETIFQYTKKNTTAWQVLTNIPGVPARENLIGTDPKNWQDSEKKELKWIINEPQETYIKQVLKEKNIENLNWFNFCIGFLSVKQNFFKEDLELAIEVTKNRIASRELPKNEIGSKGWLVVGFESLEHVRNYLRKQQEISNRQKLRLRKKGETLEEDENLVKLLYQKDDLKLYLLPSIAADKDNKYHDNWDDAEYLSKRESRKRILCKLGKGTDWCTANPSGSFHKYYVDRDIYVFHKNDQPKYQFTGCHRGLNPQFMDVKDEGVTKITNEEMEFLNNYLGDCYEYIKVKVSSPEEYMKSKFKERISLESITGLIENPETVPEILEDIYVNDAGRISYDSKSYQLLCKNPNTPKEILIDIYEKENVPQATKVSLAQNPNAPKEILADIYRNLSGKVDKLFGAELKSSLAQNPNTPKEILEKMSESTTVDMAKHLAKNKNSSIEVLQNLFSFLNKVDNNDFKTYLGICILKNPNAKLDPKLLEEILEVLKEVILDSQTYDWTIKFIQKETKYLRKEIRTKIEDFISIRGNTTKSSFDRLHSPGWRWLQTEY